MIFWSPSSRGVNGYIKVSLEKMDYSQANHVFQRLEHALQLFLASCENLADFEIKGTCGYLRDGKYVWGKYGKLPIHSSNWNFARVKEFESKSMVSIHWLAALCNIIEDHVAPDVLDRHKAHKAALGSAPIIERGFFLVTSEMSQGLQEQYGENWHWRFAAYKGDEEETWLPLRHFRTGRLPLTDAELKGERIPKPRTTDSLSDQLAAIYHRIESPEAQKPADSLSLLLADLFQKMEGEPKPEEQKQRKVRPSQGQEDRVSRRKQREVPRRTVGTASRGYLDLADLNGEPDSFKRQSDALRRLGRYLKCVPTVEEALEFLMDNNLFSGPWEGNLSHRQTRVKSILQFIASTFDARKCGNGSVNVGKYDEWARKKFPTGLVGGNGDYLTEEGEIARVEKNIRICPDFIAVFMAVCEFSMLLDKNQDDSLPHERAKELWDKLYAEGVIMVKFNARKWAVCRDELEKHGIIKITDRNYSLGKAMKWAVGLYFPFLGLWKTPKQSSLLGPVDLVAVFGRRGEREETHNTLLHPQSPGKADLAGSRLSRPPP